MPDRNAIHSFLLTLITGCPDRRSLLSRTMTASWSN